MPKSAIEPELVENVRKVLSLRESAGDDGELVLNERIDIQLDGHGNGPFIVKKRQFSFVVDEPPLRAGRDTGPNPLAYFLGGAATCYLSHFMMQAIDRELPIDDLRTAARGRFDRRAIGGHLVKVVYDIDVQSPAEESQIIEVASRAEKMCYVHNTLVKAGVHVETKVSLNGEEIAVLIADTSHL